MNAWIVEILLLVGAAFSLLAAVGVVRMPDTLTRMQPATKAMTLGVSCMSLAAALHFGQTGVTIRAAAIIVFLFATAPVAAHLVARAAYGSGLELWKGTSFDDLSHTRRTMTRDKSQD